MSPIKTSCAEGVAVREVVPYYNGDKYKVYASSISDFEATRRMRFPLNITITSRILYRDLTGVWAYRIG